MVFRIFRANSSIELLAITPPMLPDPAQQYVISVTAHAGPPVLVNGDQQFPILIQTLPVYCLFAIHKWMFKTEMTNTPRAYANISDFESVSSTSVDGMGI